MISHEQIHELSGLAARVSAIVNLTKSGGHEIPLEQMNRDMILALSQLEKCWKEYIARQRETAK